MCWSALLTKQTVGFCIFKRGCWFFSPASFLGLSSACTKELTVKRRWALTSLNTTGKKVLFLVSWTRIPNHTIPVLKLSCCSGSHSLGVGYWVCSGATQPRLCCRSLKALSCLWITQKANLWVLCLALCVQAHAGTLVIQFCSLWAVEGYE